MDRYRLDGDTQVVLMKKINGFDIDDETTYVENDKMEWVKHSDAETLLKAIRLAVSMKDLEAVEHLVREGE